MKSFLTPEVEGKKYHKVTWLWEETFDKIKTELGNLPREEQVEILNKYKDNEDIVDFKISEVAVLGSPVSDNFIISIKPVGNEHYPFMVLI